MATPSFSINGLQMILFHKNRQKSFKNFKLLLFSDFSNILENPLLKNDGLQETHRTHDDRAPAHNTSQFVCSLSLFIQLPCYSSLAFSSNQPRSINSDEIRASNSIQLVHYEQIFHIYANGYPRPRSLLLLQGKIF